MQAAVALLPLLVVACVAHALPLEPEVAAAEAEVGGTEVALPPLLAVPEEESDSDGAELLRERRSPGGWQQGRNGGSGPQDPRRQQESRGSISGNVTRERGVGTVVNAQGQANVWTSRNGNARVDAQGEYRRVVRGPARGDRNYNVGVTYTHRF